MRHLSTNRLAKLTEQHHWGLWRYTTSPCCVNSTLATLPALIQLSKYSIVRSHWPKRFFSPTPTTLSHSTDCPEAKTMLCFVPIGWPCRMQQPKWPFCNSSTRTVALRPYLHQGIATTSSVRAMVRLLIFRPPAQTTAKSMNFLLKACFSTPWGEACVSTQYEWPLICKIPKKGAIESSYFYFPAWIIWYSANFISFNHNSILILALRPYVIQGRNALVMKWVSHAELQSFNTMRVITRAHYYAFRRDFTD